MTKMNKEEMITAAKKAFGPKFRAERYWDWRNKYKKDTVEKQVDVENGVAFFTYPCGHEVELELTDPECAKMKLADYHYPKCPECRKQAYQAACKEKQDRREGLVSLGLIMEDAE
jgi:hypothetical protein